jgi:hypothetical protein
MNYNHHLFYIRYPIHRPLFKNKRSLNLLISVLPYLCLFIPSWKHLTHPSDLYLSWFEHYAIDGHSKAAVYNLVLSIKKNMAGERICAAGTPLAPLKFRI